MSRRQSGTVSIIGDLRATLDRLQAELEATSLTPYGRRRVERDIREVMGRFDTLLAELDPIRQPTSVFDPGNPKIVGRFIALALVAQPRRPLTEIGRFYGSGVYAIYYNGQFAPYSPVAGTETPIYVGKAAPALKNARTPIEQGDALSKRLGEHFRNIGLATSTLDVQDFEVRTLVVQSGWEAAAENYLIHLFQPIWNSETDILYGLGKHGDSADTRANKRSPWDTLHPGRAWAAATKHDAKTVDRIEDELRDHFQQHPVYADIDAVLRSFIDELRQI